jgi:hypothetical protein
MPQFRRDSIQRDPSTSLTSRRANQLATVKLVLDALSYRQSGSDRLAGGPF